MSKIQEVRRANLRRLLGERGGTTSLAKALGHAGPSYLSQLISAARPISEKTARKIEEQLQLPERALDRAPGEPLPFSGTDRQLLAESVRVVGAELDRVKLKLSPERYARLVALVYESSVHAGGVDAANVAKLIELIQ